MGNMKTTHVNFMTVKKTLCFGFVEKKIFYRCGAIFADFSPDNKVQNVNS